MLVKHTRKDGTLRQYDITSTHYAICPLFRPAADCICDDSDGPLSCLWGTMRGCCGRRGAPCSAAGGKASSHATPWTLAAPGEPGRWGVGPWYDANVRHDKGPPCTTRPLNAKTRRIRQVNNSRRPIFLCASPHDLPPSGFPFVCTLAVIANRLNIGIPYPLAILQQHLQYCCPSFSLEKRLVHHCVNPADRIAIRYLSLGRTFSPPHPNRKVRETSNNTDIHPPPATHHVWTFSPICVWPTTIASKEGRTLECY